MRHEQRFPGDASPGLNAPTRFWDASAPGGQQTQKERRMREAAERARRTDCAGTENKGGYGWRNDKGQLGQCDLKRRDLPTLVETLKDSMVVAAACGRAHTLFLTDHGSLFACGDNKMGQCGVGSQNASVHVPTRVAFKLRPAVRVSCGGEFSVLVDCRGHVYTFGCPEYGQLGHNTDGRYFVTSNKLQFKCELVPRRVQVFIDRNREGHVVSVDDVHIVEVASGLNHTYPSSFFGEAGYLLHTRYTRNSPCAVAVFRSKATSIERALQQHSSHYNHDASNVPANVFSANLGSSSEALREMVRSIVKEEFEKLLPPQVAPPVLSLTTLIRDEVCHAILQAELEANLFDSNSNCRNADAMPMLCYEPTYADAMRQLAVHTASFAAPSGYRSASRGSNYPANSRPR
ncbi:hypothetical protein HPB51_025545 [Rhipicephalus microplus]|uniref:Uncharacterized protein n=1 Tax=Rhipicephalus microplus TaxID=6941 RepID=A0A9J6F8M4_RHIMP|nr:hypothetical protein HPB51_025545 [Rhipicephalus microplus]